MISSSDVYALTLTFFGIRSIERTLTCISKVYFMNKIATAFVIKGCAFAGIAIVHAVNKIEKNI